jgi:hypothetical protein
MIGTAVELAGLAKLVNDGTQLFSNRTIKLSQSIDLAGREWMPIGVLARPFAGIFDGDGWTISNMTIRDGVFRSGLFGMTAGATTIVKKINMVNIDIDVSPLASGSYSASASGIVGENWGEVSECTVSGNISASFASGSLIGVGGIVGVNGGPLVSNCTSSVNVLASGSAPYAGGVVGYNQIGTVSMCTSSGSIASDSNNYFAVSGGIAGRNLRGTVSDCVSNGNVSGVTYSNSSVVYIGGIVGWNAIGTVSNCQKPIGSVNASGIRLNHAGGVVGSNNDSSSPNGDTTISGNTFSKTATGQEYGIGWDYKKDPSGPSNAGAAPTD